MTDQTVDTRPKEGGPKEGGTKEGGPKEGQAKEGRPKGAGQSERTPLASRLRIDPRFRQRLIQVKREEGRRRLRVLIAATSMLVVLVLAFGAAKSPLLSVRHVRVSGAVNTPAAAIVQAAGLVGNPHMIDVNAGRAARLIRGLPWVDRVTVRRSWPTTVEVRVSERVPVATVGSGSALVLVDKSGRILGPPSPGVPATPLPSVVAATKAAAATPIGPPGSALDPSYGPGLLVATALTPGLASRVGGVVASADGSVMLQLVGGATALLGQPTDALDEKLQAVQTLLDQVKITTETIDVTVASAPVLTGAGPPK